MLTQKPGRYILRDNEKVEVIADSLLQPVFCLRAGVRHDAVAPITAAGGGSLEAYDGFKVETAIDVSHCKRSSFGCGGRYRTRRRSPVAPQGR